MNPARKSILLEKFFNDQCSAEELDELLNSYHDLNNQEQDEEIIEEEMKKVMAKLEIKKKLSVNKSEAIFNKIILSSQENEVYTDKKYSKSGWYLKIAAAFIGLLVTAGIAYQFFISEGMIYQKTSYGETKELILPDGSKVVLNSNSSISYHKGWDRNKPREVELIGEAFFQVTHKKNNQKFLVKTKQINVEVLGTEFNVLSRKNRSQVVLNSGKVKLNVKEKEELVMIPGEIVELQAGENTIRKSSGNTQLYSSWKDNVLTFQGTSLAEIAIMLEENYGKKVIIKNKALSNEKITGRFPVNEDIDLLVKMLSKAFHCKTTEKNGYLIFEN